MKEVIVGIDIGGTNTAIGIVDGGGNILSQNVVPTRRFDTPDLFVGAISDSCKAMLNGSAPTTRIKAVGVGAPNGNFYTGDIKDAPNLRWRGHIPLAKLIEDAMDCPTVLTNDANAAAIGEMIYGHAQGMKDFVVITIGTGLGSGIVVNGDLLYGKTGFAGELGHTVAVRHGRECTCGKLGCLEAYVSARGLRQTAEEILESNRFDSSLYAIPPAKLNAKAIFEAAEQGDPVALEAFHLTGDILGAQLADTVAYLSPEAIFLFGGIANAGDHLLNSARASMEANMLSIFRGTVKLLPSALNERNGAILGAAALARKAFGLD